MRLKQALANKAISQAALAEACDCSPQRMGNYMQGTRTPNIGMLVKIASALDVSNDWLLGVRQFDAGSGVGLVLTRVLELDGMGHQHAAELAELTEKAIRLYSSLPDEADQNLKSRLAAQAIWNARDLNGE